MSKYARAADLAYLRQRRLQRAPRLVVGEKSNPAKGLFLIDHGEPDECAPCGHYACSPVMCSAIKRKTSPQPPPEPQPTRFAVGDVFVSLDYNQTGLSTKCEHTVTGDVAGVTMSVKRNSDGAAFGAAHMWLRDGVCKIVRRAGEAQPAPALREGWERNGSFYRFLSGESSGTVFAGRCDRFTVADDRINALVEDMTVYPTLDAAMDAVEAAVLGAEGWTRDDGQLVAEDRAAGDCIYRHASGACVRLFDADSEAAEWWAYTKPVSGFKAKAKTRAEAMRIALGQVSE